MPGIDPAHVARVLRHADGVLVKLLNTAPLESRELEEGGQVFAPIFDHYLPNIAARGGIWFVPAVWALGTYGPRALEAVDKYQERKASRAAAAQSQREGTPAGAGTFREPSAPATSAAARDAARRGVVLVEGT